MYNCKVTCPNDVAHPFPEEIYTDPLVIYHGTTSGYSEVIERDGFQIDGFTFSLQDIKQLVDISDALGQKSWSYTVLKGLSKRLEYPYKVKRPIYFSQAFWHAREYASNVGGETIHNAFLVIEHLEALKVHQHPDFGALFAQVQAIKVRLLHLTAGSFPIVYAVSAKKEWFTNWEDVEEYGDFSLPQVNLVCYSTVPAVHILAKAEYVNGVKPGYLLASNLKLSWQQACELPKST